MKAFDQTEIRWNAGRVSRWHAHPTVHDQTVADHTYGVLQWLTFIVPPAALTKRMMLAALNHDIAEIFTGDIPFTAKRLYPDLKQALDHAEVDIHERLGANWVLLDAEVSAIKFADLTEMGFYAIREHTLGNSFMVPVIDNIIADLDRICNEYSGGSPNMRIILDHFIQERSSWEVTTNRSAASTISQS